MNNLNARFPTISLLCYFCKLHLLMGHFLKICLQLDGDTDIALFIQKLLMYTEPFHRI